VLPARALRQGKKLIPVKMSSKKAMNLERILGPLSFLSDFILRKDFIQVKSCGMHEIGKK
jgi:hypothetical protein